jgi:hypothetical protein
MVAPTWRLFENIGIGIRVLEGKDRPLFSMKYLSNGCVNCGRRCCDVGMKNESARRSKVFLGACVDSSDQR